MQIYQQKNRRPNNACHVRGISAKQLHIFQDGYLTICNKIFDQVIFCAKLVRISVEAQKKNKYVETVV